jgi:hypothetical protein
VHKRLAAQDIRNDSYCRGVCCETLGCLVE